MEHSKHVESLPGFFPFRFCDSGHHYQALRRMHTARFHYETYGKAAAQWDTAGECQPSDPASCRQSSTACLNGFPMHLLTCECSPRPQCHNRSLAITRFEKISFHASSCHPHPKLQKTDIGARQRLLYTECLSFLIFTSSNL